MREGWICPKCDRVFSPSCQQCLFCNGEAINHKSPKSLPVYCDYCQKDCSDAYHVRGSRLDGNHWNICVDCWNEKLGKKE